MSCANAPGSMRPTMDELPQQRGIGFADVHLRCFCAPQLGTRLVVDLLETRCPAFALIRVNVGAPSRVRSWLATSAGCSSRVATTQHRIRQGRSRSAVPTRSSSSDHSLRPDALAMRQKDGAPNPAHDAAHSEVVTRPRLGDDHDGEGRVTRPGHELEQTTKPEGALRGNGRRTLVVAELHRAA